MSSDCARRRAQDEGDNISPRRRLSRRRVEAWSDRADRPHLSGGRRRRFGRPVRKDRFQPARSGRIILIGNEPGIAALASITEASIALPEADPLIAPVIAAIPLQLLAYHTALARGTDV